MIYNLEIRDIYNSQVRILLLIEFVVADNLVERYVRSDYLL